jgi:hypothetical protein
MAHGQECLLSADLGGWQNRRALAYCQTELLQQARLAGTFMRLLATAVLSKDISSEQERKL